jgi:hypothetical protein
VRCWGRLLPILAVLAGCSGLDEGEGGVVGLEVQVPVPATLEVGDALQLEATALDAEGNPVDASVSWRAADATVSVSPTGLATGVSVGTGRVQALSGSLASNLVTLTVIARADTLILVGDSIRSVPPDPGASGDLVTALRTLSPDAPVADRGVIYTITSPAPGAAPAVTLTGGVQTDTVNTGPNGTVTGVQLLRVAGSPPVPSAIVTVRAVRTRGTEVPGSGQRFTIRFE